MTACHFGKAGRGGQPPIQPVIDSFINSATREVDEQMLNVQNKNSSYFVEWIPNNITTGKTRSVRQVLSAQACQLPIVSCSGPSKSRLAPEPSGFDFRFLFSVSAGRLRASLQEDAWEYAWVMA